LKKVAENTLKEASMKYQIKAVIKNKITWFMLLCIAVWSLYTMFQVVFGEEDIYKKSIECELEANGYQSTYNELLARINLDSASYEKHKSVYEARLKMLEKMENTNREESEFFADGIYTKEEKEKVARFNILFYILNMDYFANPKKDRPYFKEVFAKELKEYPEIKELVDALDFDTQLLSQWEEGSSEEGKSSEYLKYKNGLTWVFHAYSQDKDIFKILSNEPGPCLFLYSLLSTDKLFSLLLPVVTLLFSAAIVLEDEKNRSIGLLYSTPTGKSRVLWHYLGTVLAVVLGGLLLLLGVIVVFLGLRYGFGGFRDVILVYEKNYTAFRGNRLLWEDTGMSIGLSKIYYSGFVQLHGYSVGAFPSNMILYPMWKFFLRLGVLGILKFVFYILLGLLPGLLVRSKAGIYTAIMGLAAVTVLSQLAGKLLLFNPLSIAKVWDVTTGASPFTWLRAVILLGGSCVLLIGMFFVLGRKKDRG
jgi:hypothetical protein